MSVTFILLVLALACFLLAAFNVNNKFFSWVPMGLALWVLTLLFNGWPPHLR